MRILMLEDSFDDASLLRRIILRNGITAEFKHVTDGTGFDAALKSFSPQVILSDNQVPSFSGIEALQSCRRNNPFVPFILVTGTASEEFAASMVRDGADDYLLKHNLDRLPTAILQAVKKKQTEESLYHSEANLRSIFDNTDTTYILLDGDFNVIFLNVRALASMRGVFPHPPAIGENIFSLRQGQDQSRFDSIKNEVAAGRVVEYETQFSEAPAKPWYHVKFLPFRDTRGTLTGSIIAISDITVRKNLEAEKEKSSQALAAREQRFRALIENSWDGIVVNDTDSTIIYQSPSVERITGYSLEERLGKKAKSYIHPDDREAFTTMQRQVTAIHGSPVPFQHRVRHKEGHYVWVEGVVTNWTSDASVNGIVANYRDITLRKHAQENLELTLKRFRQAQEMAHLGNWYVDFAGQTTTWSDETFRMYGLVPGSMPPSEALFLHYVHPDDAEHVRTTIARGKQNLKSFSFFQRILQSTGDERTLFTVGHFEFNESGEATGLYGISLDITELREKEVKLQLANKELEIFIYKTYHDLRAPIASTLGVVNLARIDVKEQTAREYFDMVESLACKQTKMLQNLASVMTLRGQVLHPTAIDFDILIAEVLKQLSPMPSFDTARIKIDNRTTRTFAADRHALSGILFHLIENAVQYRRLECFTCEIVVDIHFDDHGNVVVHVKDNGVGMPDQIKEHAFDMFFRGCETSTGSGLGLYFVKNAVDKMGGHIEVLSKAGAGSEFFLTIPEMKG